MTAELVDRATGVVITHGDVRDSIAIARSHGEKFFEQIVWQVENEVWLILGYASWDEMREAEYGDLGVVAPRSDRPELVSRLRRQGLTQREIGATLGVHEATVSRELANASSEPAATITNSRGQERPASYAPRPAPEPVEGNVLEPDDLDQLAAEVAADPVAQAAYEAASSRAPRRRALEDSFLDAFMDLQKRVATLTNLAADDRFPRNKEQIAAKYRNDLLLARDALDRLIGQLN
jgi:hypothetical protein